MSGLPHGWSKLALRDIGDWYGGGTPSKARPDYWAEGTVPWLSPKDMGPDVLSDTQDHITTVAVSESAVRYVPAGSVAVVVRSGILERKIPISLVPFETTLNQDMKAVHPRSEVDVRWIAWGLRAYESVMMRELRKAGTTVASIDTRRLLDFELPIPPLDEQRRIVGILEDHFSRLDAANNYLASSVLRSRKLLESLEATALDRPNLPSGWTVRLIGDLADLGSGATPLKARKDFYEGGGIPWVTSGDLSQEFITKPTKFITETALAETAVKMWPAGTLLVAMYGEGKTRGRSTELAIDATTNQACAAICIKDDCIELKPWVKLFLTANYRRMRRLAAGGVQPNLSQGIIKNLAVPIPPADERDLILNEVTRYRDAVAQLNQEIARAEQKSRSLRRASLVAAFSGGI